MSDIGSRPGRTVRVDEPVPAERPHGAHEVPHRGTEVPAGGEVPPAEATAPMAAAESGYADPRQADPGYAQPAAAPPGAAPAQAGWPYARPGTEFGEHREDQREHRDDHRDRPNPMDEAVATLKREDNRIKLLIAIAVMSGLAMLFALVAMIAALDDGGAEGEPVLVDGVPCLIGEAAGDDDNAVLYCQR